MSDDASTVAVTLRPATPRPAALALAPRRANLADATSLQTIPDAAGPDAAGPDAAGPDAAGLEAVSQDVAGLEAVSQDAGAGAVGGTNDTNDTNDTDGAACDTLGQNLTAVGARILAKQADIETLLHTLALQQTEVQQAHKASLHNLSLQSTTERRIYMMAVDLIYFRRQTLMSVEIAALERMFRLQCSRIYGDCYRLYRIAAPHGNQFPAYVATEPLAQYDRTLLEPLIQALLDATTVTAPLAGPRGFAVMHRCLSHALAAQQTGNTLLLQCGLDTLTLHLQGLEHICSQLQDVHHLHSSSS